MPNSLSGLLDYFDSTDLAPHGLCLLWRPELIWLHVVSDGLIALAYFSIPIVLSVFVLKRPDFGFGWVIFAFVVFITACGTTHVFGIWTLWFADYGAEGAVKGITALASVATAIGLWPLLPRVLVLPSPEQLQSKNRDLESAVKELDAFSYSVSHDLRAPLRAIEGFSRILLKQHAPELSPEGREYLDLVRENTVQMGHLVDDLLAFARLGRQPLVTRPISTRTMVKQVVREVRQQHEGRAVTVSLGDLPDLRGDPRLLKQVFINLVDNAFKYTRRKHEAHIDIASREVDGERVFSVRDDGVGFDTQYADKLFGVFQRMHRAEDFEGTGVGLAIVQRVIHRHGGRIWAEAAVDQGATFSFTIGSPKP
jgi:signal transduction histidine kinase